ncbi:hypothetical protein [Streptomyces bluensis]|uniref:Uncharacterized protein n=1 Tax=Streptomyces bluensis TaxID=33897 RepID=A0ABW6UU59_9ACTN
MPPDAQTVHPGHGIPHEDLRQRICTWLKANGINPEDVVATRPVYVLAVPNGTIQGGLPWLIDVIVFHQFYRRSDGCIERDFINREAAMFQRTVPLTVPFPTDPTTDGEDHGQADSKAAQQAPQVQVRPAPEAGVSAGHQGEGEERPGQGVATRDEGTAEEGSGRGHEALSEPEEDQWQEDGQPEEVEGDR